MEIFQCNVCNCSKSNSISSKVRDSHDFKIKQCKNCSHIQIFPIPTYEENKIFYDEDRMSRNIKFHSIKNIEQKKLTDTLLYVEFTKKISTKKSRILEIGSGYGHFLNVMNKDGYDITGIEVSKYRRNFAKKLTKLNVLDFDLTKDVPKLKKFDVIVMFQVLEYISNPITFLKNLRELLKKNGKLLIIIPNADDLSLKVNKKYNDWFWQRAHVNYFTPKTVKNVLKKSNFKIIELEGIQRYGIENMFHWRLIGEPQFKKPSFELIKEYRFLDVVYKNYLESNLLSDTMMILAKKN